MKTINETLVITKKQDITELVNKYKSENIIVGLVPTMGALHKGHISLVEASVKNCDRTIVTIFVNPLQFGPKEDLQKYPREFESDLEKCRKAGVSIVFAPSEKEMYPEGREKTFKVVPPDEYTSILCGKCRPGHFDGVATVVTKLFNIIPAHKAYFGQKDAQQLFIIKKLVSALDEQIEIITCATAREDDGLACSSRNKYLDQHSRAIAINLYKTLKFIKSLYLAGNNDFTEISTLALKEIIAKFDDIRIEYLSACDYNNLKLTNELKPETLIAIAARIGDVRLIDNIILE